MEKMMNDKLKEIRERHEKKEGILVGNAHLDRRELLKMVEGLEAQRLRDKHTMESDSETIIELEARLSTYDDVGKQLDIVSVALIKAEAQLEVAKKWIRSAGHYVACSACKHGECDCGKAAIGEVE